MDDRPYLEPVQLEVVRLCQFKAKPCRICDKPMSNRIHKEPKGTPECPGQKQLGCATCGRNKGDVAHFGAPQSLNVFVSGYGSGNAHVFQGQKQAWQKILLDELRTTNLPRGLGRVFAEAEITFPDYREDRDQGNFRVLPEKALGDALMEGGYLENDDWTRYEMGGFTHRVQPGESATRIVLLPSWERSRPTTQETLPL